MTFELSPEQMLYLGIIASLLTTVLRLGYEFFAKRKIVLPTWVQNLIVFAVGGGLAVLWLPQTLPPFPPPSGEPATDIPAYLAWLGSTLAVLTGVLSFAVFIYNYLIKTVRDRLNPRLLPALYGANPKRKK
jgi:branched-subunit amino acid transport protein